MHPEVVIVIGPRGVRSVHFASESYAQERAAVSLYRRVQPHVDAIDAALAASRRS